MARTSRVSWCRRNDQNGALERSAWNLREISGGMARDYRSMMLSVRLLPALLFVIPLGASATIYQWTDETGHVVLGNQVPETAKNVRPVMQDDPAPATNNRELEERINRLERQGQAMQAAPQQYAPPAPYPTPPMSYPAPAPMPADYYGAGYYPGMYPPPPYYPYGYYPYGFGYPIGVTVVRRVPVRGFVRGPHV